MEPNGEFEYFIPISFLLILLIPGGIFIWVVRQVRRGLLTTSKGTRCFLVYSLVPIALYAAVFPLSLAVERATHITLVSEAYGRSLFAVVTIGAVNVIVMCGIFYMVARWYGSQRRGKHTD